MDSRLILASEDPQDIQFAQEVASTSRRVITRASSAREARDALLAHPESALFFGIGGAADLEAFDRDLAPAIGDGEGDGRIDPRRIHVIVPPTLEIRGELSAGRAFGSLLTRTYGDPRFAGAHYGKLVMAGSHDAPVRTVQLLHSDDKKAALAEVEAFLAEHASFHSRIVSTIVTAVDELLMNAIYDAQPDDEGGQAMKCTPRSLPVELDDARKVELELRSFGDYFAFTVVDRYGSLDRSSIFSHVLRRYKSGEYQVDDSAAGAGLGLVTIFQMGGSLIYACEPGCRTEATVLFRKVSSYKDFKGQFRFVTVQT